MALLKLVYRDELFPREVYRLTFEQLRERLSDRAACKLMVEILSLAHERACEAPLAVSLTETLADSTGCRAGIPQHVGPPFNGKPTECFGAATSLSSYESLVATAGELA